MQDLAPSARVFWTGGKRRCPCRTASWTDGPVDEAFLFHLHERDLTALPLRQQLDGLLDPSFYGGALLPDPDRVERNEPPLPGRGQLQNQPAAASRLVSRAAAEGAFRDEVVASVWGGGHSDEEVQRLIAGAGAAVVPRVTAVKARNAARTRRIEEGRFIVPPGTFAFRRRVEAAAGLGCLIPRRPP